MYQWWITPHEQCWRIQAVVKPCLLTSGMTGSSNDSVNGGGKYLKDSLWRWQQGTNYNTRCLISPLVSLWTNLERMQRYKGKGWISGHLWNMFSPWYSLLFLFTPFQSKPVSYKMDGLRVARFPKVNTVWLLLYLRSKNKRVLSTCRTVGVGALIWTRKRVVWWNIDALFNCVLWELSLLSGCVRWSTILLRLPTWEWTGIRCSRSLIGLNESIDEWMCS